MVRLLVLLPLLACAAEPTSARWLSDVSWRWSVSNHRLSAFTARPVEEGMQVALVGGASTTGVFFEGDAACQADGDCVEIPVLDSSDLSATVQVADGVDAGLQTGRVSLVIGADGTATEELRVPVLRDGVATAWLGGWSWDLQRPLPAEAAPVSCYDPRHGWLLRTLGLEVGEVRRQGDELVVPVTGRFEAGLSFEEIRGCLDRAVPFAEVGVVVDVVVGEDVDARALTVSQGAAWPWTRGEPVPEQTLAEVGPTAVDLRGQTPAWQSVQFVFHRTVEPERGVYLRSLAIKAEAVSDLGYGFAQNDAPAFLLQAGFDYGFQGRLLALDLPIATQAFAVGELAATLEEDGTPVLTTLTP